MPLTIIEYPLYPPTVGPSASFDLMPSPHLLSPPNCLSPCLSWLISLGISHGSLNPCPYPHNTLLFLLAPWTSQPIPLPHILNPVTLGSCPDSTMSYCVYQVLLYSPDII